MSRLTANGLYLVAAGLFLQNVPYPNPPDFALNGYKPGANVENIVLALGAGGAWDDTKILHPCAVAWNGTVYLFFSGYNGSVWKIGVATAATTGFTGVNFTKYGSNPILSDGGGGAWDDDGVSDPWVIYDQYAGLWKMWYRGFTGAVNKIGYATAPTPFGPWTKSGSNPVLSPAGWEGNLVLLPSVLRLSATDYRMLYAGNAPASTDGRIGLATSADGITWAKYGGNPVLTPTTPGTGSWMGGSVFSPRTLLFDGMLYHLYFSAKEAVPNFSKSGYAESPDLINWTVGAASPILSASHAWEGTANPPGETENPNYIWLDGTGYIFYDCWWGVPSTIGVAVVPM